MVNNKKIVVRKSRQMHQSYFTVFYSPLFLIVLICHIFASSLNADFIILFYARETTRHEDIRFICCNVLFVSTLALMIQLFHYDRNLIIDWMVRIHSFTIRNVKNIDLCAFTRKMSIALF